MSLNVIKDYIKDKKQNKVVMPYTLDSCVQNADGTKTLSLTDIDNLKGDIDEHARRITNLENASKGILYDTITDSTEAYIKSIRSDAVDGFGMLDKIGGKSIVQNNQIIDISVDKAICKKADGTISKEITLPTVSLKGINSTVYDIADFENNKVVRKVGSRDYQAGDESNPNYITDMTTTYYPLATATETTLSTDEIIIPIEASGSVTFNNTYGSPIPSDITYNIHTS